MKHFQVKFIRNTDHPQGRKVLETYVAAETKAEAKVKASRYLFEQDGEYALFYKAPRLEEISVALHLSKTEQEFTPVDDAAIKQYCALLSLFGEEESYSEGELRDAETLLNYPEREEAEDVAHYDALLQKVTTHRGAMAQDATLEDIKSAALCLYRGGEPELPPGSVDKPEENSPEITETVEAVEDDTTVTDPPGGDNRSFESDEDKARDCPDLELDIARALWQGELHWEAIPSEVEQSAQNRVKRRDGEMMHWFPALRKVPDILSRSREFIFKVIRSPHNPEIYLTPEAIDAYIAGFVEREAVDKMPWSEKSTDDIAETPTLERDAQRLAKFLAPEAVDLLESPDTDDGVGAGCT